VKAIRLRGLAFIAVALIGGFRAAAAEEACSPVGNVGFICGPLNSADLVQVPGTTWIVGSGIAGGGAGTRGALHLIDSVDKFSKMLFPAGSPQVLWDKANYGDCPGPPDLAKFSAQGLDLSHADNETSTLYVVNHGGRQSIEFFALDIKEGEPTVVWIGCAVMPAGTWPHSVAPLPEGGMVVTSTYDPGDPRYRERLAAGAATGAVYEWHPHQGFTLVPGSRLSGDKGIEVSRDGKWIYVTAWGGKAVARLERGKGAAVKRDILPAGFLVDNLRWAPGGQLIVAGQNAAAGEVLACTQSDAPRCTEPWRIDRWDTGAMTLKPVASEPGNPEFGDATVGLQIGADMFVGTFRGDRVAYFSLR
jgi:hypothetical protein